MASRRQVALAAWLLLLSACSGGSGQPSTSENPLDIKDVVYVGLPTDEALLRLLDGKAKDDARQYVSVLSPDLTAPLSKDEPPTLQFRLASEASQRHLRPSSSVASSPAWKRSLRELVQLLGPIREAAAHGIPYNGTAYFLVFTDASGKRTLRVFTNQTSYTPAEANWKTLSEAAQPLSLDIMSAYFEENEIPDDGGPFLGGKFELTIQ